VAVIDGGTGRNGGHILTLSPGAGKRNRADIQGARPLVPSGIAFALMEDRCTALPQPPHGRGQARGSGMRGVEDDVATGSMYHEAGSRHSRRGELWGWHQWRSGRGPGPAPGGDCPPRNVFALLASPLAPHAGAVGPWHTAPPDPTGDRPAASGTRPQAGLRAVITGAADSWEHTPHCWRTLAAGASHQHYGTAVERCSGGHDEPTGSGAAEWMGHLGGTKTWGDSGDGRERLPGGW
jgi:hypothetical protein